MDTENRNCSISIDGRWTASEMAASLQEINFLYDLRLYLNSIEDAEPYFDELYHFFPPFRHWMKNRGLPWPHGFPHTNFLYRPEDLRQYTRIYLPNFELRIARLEYASPGSKDFLGLGEVLKQIVAFIQYLIELPERKEKQRLENASLRIQNAREFVKLRVEYARGNAEIGNVNNDGLASLVDDNTRTILRLVEEKKITSAVMLETNEKSAE